MHPPNALADYQRMRDFGHTPEPSGTVVSSSATLAFVVQKHAAHSLHYDFRLELDGTLKSWAVPKGPSLDPTDKRMAVQVEDHPMAYASFEGNIPPGHYGAGNVIVWDTGTWSPVGDAQAGLRAGKLKFVLHGEKLHGLWALVRMKQREGERQEAWLLIKERDAFSRKLADYDVVLTEPGSVLAPRSSAPTATAATMLAPRAVPHGAFPARLAPQLASLVGQPPRGSGWLYEIKFDGYRLLVRANGRTVHAFTRNGIDWSTRLPELVAAVRALGLQNTWLDGEIIVEGAGGAPDFQALQNAFDAGRTDAIRYHLFDLPFHDGQDLRELPVEQRRTRLKALLDAHPQATLRFSEAFEAEPAALLESARQLGLEGLIGKRKGSPYRSQRSTDWIKLKLRHRQDFVVAGFTEPKGSRRGIGALLLGVHAEDGSLRYAGNVGSGFDEHTLATLRARLDPLEISASPFIAAPTRMGNEGDSLPRWVRPVLLAEVSFAQWTKERRLRHAVFHGLRADKTAARITEESAVTSTHTAPDAPATPAAPVSAAIPRHQFPAASASHVTHADRVIDNASGTTKGELVAFYEQVAPVMLPHLRHRPTALLRAPAGIGGELFFQKHAQGDVLRGMTRLSPALDPGHEPLLAVASVAGLMTSAQMNVIEFHTWNATVNRIDKPDRIVFDLDPGIGVAWPAIREAAQLLRAFLAELKLIAFLKTSGGKGLHVVVPLTPHHNWDVLKRFAQAVVQHVASVVPARFVSKSGPRNRVGKIYIDYLRNGFGATTVCAWSARARPGLGVSVPVGWDELTTLDSAMHWTVRNIGTRLAVGNQPWAAYSSSRHGLANAMRVLAFDPKGAPA